MGNIIYSADVLEQVINLIDKWWPNIGQKEALTIVFTTGAPRPDAPTVVRILPMRQTLVLIFQHYLASRRRGIVLQWI